MYVQSVERPLLISHALLNERNHNRKRSYKRMDVENPSIAMVTSLCIKKKKKPSRAPGWLSC